MPGTRMWMVATSPTRRPARRDSSPPERLPKLFTMETTMGIRYEGILIGNLHNWSEIEELCGLWILQPLLMTRGPRRNYEVIFHVVNHVFPPKVGGSIHVYPRVGPWLPTGHLRSNVVLRCGGSEGWENSCHWESSSFPVSHPIKKTIYFDDLCSGCSLKSKCTSRARSIYSEYFWIIITGWWFGTFLFFHILGIIIIISD